MNTLEHSHVDYQLGLFKDQLRTSYPGYPAFSERLFTPLDQLKADTNSRIIIPSGPWEIQSSPGFKERPPQTISQQLYKEGELANDSSGRPLHPWLEKMLANEAIGAVFGMGAYWQHGASHVADTVVTKGNCIALICRKDTGSDAIAGGFIEDGEQPGDAAEREAQEEYGNPYVLNGATRRHIYSGPVVDPRLTANAWPVTHAFHFELDQASPFPEIIGSDDAREAMWITKEKALKMQLFGSHSYLLRLALQAL